MSNNQQENSENFADLLENSLTQKARLTPGQSIETEIISISADCIFLNLDGKSEGILDAAEFTDDEGNITVKEGETIKAYFKGAKDGEMLFTTKIGTDNAGKAQLKNAFENGIPVEGSVEKEIKGGFEVKVGEARAFCPYSQMGSRRVENADEFIGKKMTFKITEYSENGRNILLSNRKILEEQHQAHIDDLKTSLKEGMVVNGTIKSIRDFGAFVEIQGVQALLPISEISRTRVEDINAVLSEGQEIEASILSINWQTERISVSMKQLQPDPWDEAAAKYKTGSIHTGTIVRLAAFGAFVQLEPGLDGLIHISDLDSETRISHPRQVVNEGQTLEVKINSVDTDKKRISLKMLSESKEEEDYTSYMDDNSDTYNPFSALLKDKSKKEKK